MTLSFIEITTLSSYKSKCKYIRIASLRKQIIIFRNFGQIRQNFPQYICVIHILLDIYYYKKDWLLLLLTILLS